MSARLAAFVTWALVALSATFWALKLFVAAPGAPAHAQAVDGGALRGDWSRVLGTAPVDAPADAPAPPPQASRFQLIGVAAPRVAAARSEGVALIAIDGKPARPYRVGALVDGDWHLQSVHARGVSLGPSGGSAALTLELPLLPPPATGTLPAAGAEPGTPVALPPGMVPVPPPGTMPVAPAARGPGGFVAPPGQQPRIVPAPVTVPPPNLPAQSLQPIIVPPPTGDGGLPTS